MVTVTFIDYQGAIVVTAAQEGTSVMKAAVDAGIPAIEGECGGAGACATCHVYVPAEWQPLTGPRTEAEDVMLEFGTDVDVRSRLGCQIILIPALDGLTVHTPRSQR